MKSDVEAVDLFCGAGGTSSGLAEACLDLNVNVHLTAINHWEIAVASHRANHPWATHLCQRVESTDPTEVVPSGRLDLVVASPECTHFSTARGGKPIQDQKRASPWYVLPWLSRLYVKAALIENVPEFQTWGPLGADGRPMKSRKRETFKAFIHAIEAHGYTVSYRVLNAADYGDATSRKRLFILARRGNHLIQWPQQTHSKGGKVKGTKPWRAAREIIDWSIEGKSIFERERPLAPATMRRILAGLERFGGPDLQPFLVIMRGTEARQIDASAKSIDDPVPGISANGNHVGFAEPFVLGQQSGSAPRSVADPLPTIATGGAISKVDAFLLTTDRIGTDKTPGTNRSLPRSVEDPVPTITGRPRVGLVEPFMVRTGYTGGKSGRPARGLHGVDEPMPTQTSRDETALVQPFILPPLGYHHRDGKANKPRSVDEPLQTITRRGGGHLVSAHIQSHFGEREGQEPRVHSVNQPLPTVTSREPALVEGVLVQYNGQSTASSIEDPVPTLTTKDRLALVQPVLNGWKLDIRFRMLQPHELAGAMGFKPDYQFTGNRQEVVRQIGNAVAVNMAKALCLSLLNPGA